MWTRLASDCFVEPACRTPMLRPNGAEMSRGAFLTLVSSWCGGLGILLLAALVVRVVG
jgi:hypothetical protein